MKRFILILIITVTSVMFGGGHASFYGGRLHGSMTASGERFNQYAFTAAHKKLPIGTIVRVTNPSNGKSTIVRINDRGPYIKGRVIDLSAASFKAIENPKVGVIKNIIIEVLSYGSGRKQTSNVKKVSKIIK